MNGKAGQYCSCTAKKQVSQVQAPEESIVGRHHWPASGPPALFCAVQFTRRCTANFSPLYRICTPKPPKFSTTVRTPDWQQDGSRMPGPGYPTGRHGTRYIHKHGRVSLLQSTLASNTEKVAFLCRLTSTTADRIAQPHRLPILAYMIQISACGSSRRSRLKHTPHSHRIL